MDLSRANVEFHIEELVLHGFEGRDLPGHLSPRDRPLIAAAVQQELSRLFSEQVPRSLTQSSEAPHLSTNMQLSPGMTPDAIGVQIAQSIYGGLSG